MRTAVAESKMPRKVPLVGHLPIVRQFQVLGVLLVTFLVLAAFVMFLDVAHGVAGHRVDRDRDRNADAVAAAGARHRRSRRRGRPRRSAAIKDSRDRFRRTSTRCRGAAPSRA